MFRGAIVTLLRLLHTRLRLLLGNDLRHPVFWPIRVHCGSIVPATGSNGTAAAGRRLSRRSRFLLSKRRSIDGRTAESGWYCWCSVRKRTGFRQEVNKARLSIF